MKKPYTVRQIFYLTNCMKYETIRASQKTERKTND